MPVKREGQCIIDVMIEGVDPLQFNRFTDAAKRSIEKGSTGVTKGEKVPGEVEAHNHGYFDAKDRPYIPVKSLFNCLIEAGTLIKKGRSKLTTTKTSLLPGLMWFIGREFPILMRINGQGRYAPAKWRVEKAHPQTVMGERVTVHRPAFDEWLIKFKIGIDSRNFSVVEARELIDMAGQFKGLGTERRGRKGTWGGFVVSEWKPEGVKE